MIIPIYIEEVLRIVLTSLPARPFLASAGCHSSTLRGSGGEDRISRLPDAVLSNIVSRLPAKDAARTTALSRRWRRVWAFTPLILDDTDLINLPAGIRPSAVTVPVDWCAVTCVVDRILTGHPGPYRSICLTCCTMALAEGTGALARWLHRFAAAGVEDLILVSRPWPHDVPLPVAIFHIASVRSLYLGFWNFPDIAGLPRDTPVFPKLLEIGLCHVCIDTEIVERLLACSPVLEKIVIVSSDFDLVVRIGSQSLKCVVLWMSVAEELYVVASPRLERLILWHRITVMPSFFRIKVQIGYATELKVLGYLEPSIHQLMIGTTIIESGTKMSQSTMVPSVRILALGVRFAVRNDAKMLLAFLRCFPNTETLHIMSQDVDEPTGKLNFKFWQQEVGPINCLETHITKVVFDEFRGKRGELEFLKFVLERAQSLLKLVVVLANADPASVDEMAAKLDTLTTVNRASDWPRLLMVTREGGSAWCCQRASDLSVSDPFDG